MGTLLKTSKLLSITFALVLMLLPQSAFAGKKTWNGSVSSDWFDASNWDGGKPGSGDDADIPTGKPNYPIISSGAAVAKNIKVKGSGATLTITGGTLTGYDKLKIEDSGEIIQTGGTVSVKGVDRIKTGGTYTQSGSTSLLKVGEIADGDFKMDANGFFVSSGGTVEMKPSAAKKIEQKGTNNCTFYNLIISGSGMVVKQNSEFKVKGNFTNTGGIKTDGGNTLNIFFNGITPQTFTSGGDVTTPVNYTVNSGATLQMADATTIVKGTSFNLQSGATLGIRSTEGITTAGNATGNIQTTTRTFSTGASYIYNGSANQHVGNALPITVNNLTIANTGGVGNETVDLGPTPANPSPPTITGDLTISDGTFDIRWKTVDHSLPAGGTFSMADGTTLIIRAAINFPANYSSVSLGCNSVVNYKGTDQTISPQDYGTVLLDNSGTKTLTGTASVCIAFEVNSGVTLQMGDATSTITGTQFDLKSGATLGIRATNGISSSGATGHIQTTTRNFNTAANYIYNGAANQNVGSGLSVAVASLTIANTGDGSSFDNEVVLYKDVTAADVTVSSGVLSVTNSAILGYTNSISNNANIEFNEDAALDGTGAIPGSGTITILRSFDRSGWQHISFPVKSTTTKTLGDIVKFGEPFNYTDPIIPQTNIFYWDAATAGWLIPTSATTIDKPFNIFSFVDGEGVQLTVDNADFNNENFSQPYTYFANSSGANVTTPGNTDPDFGTDGWADAVVDGWNLFANPFQAYINSTDLNADLTSNPNIDAGVYVWNGTSYTLDPTFVNPHQAYFVHTNAGSGNFTIQNAVRDNTGTGAGFFKTNNEMALILTSGDIHLKTILAENYATTDNYDASFDAYYLLSYTGKNATMFNSVGVDSMMYAKNQVQNLSKQPIYLSFGHKQNNRSFTISLDAVNGPDIYFAALEDLHTGTLTDLFQEDYKFFSTSDAPAQRFKIHFNRESAKRAADKYNTEFSVWNRGNELMFGDNINIENTVINVFALSGKLILSQSFNDSPIYFEETGVFLVQVSFKTGETINTKLIKY